MFTVYNEENNRDELVEEPDPSLTYTYADYMRWNFIERLELFRGKIMRMSAPNSRHQVIIGNLYLLLGNFLKKQSCKVYLSPLDVRLPKNNMTDDDQITTVVQPDLIVVCDPSKIEIRGCCGAPDLVLEVLSPGNRKKDILLKYELYEEAGVREYWIADPSRKTLMVHLMEENNRFGGGKRYTCGQAVTSHVIPGFVIQDLSEIFEE